MPFSGEVIRNRLPEPEKPVGKQESGAIKCLPRDKLKGETLHNSITRLTPPSAELD